jgi:hypothetical protein
VTVWERLSADRPTRGAQAAAMVGALVREIQRRGRNASGVEIRPNWVAGGGCSGRTAEDGPVSDAEIDRQRRNC